MTVRQRKNCPRCYGLMHDIGNLTGVVPSSNPLKWINVYVCHKCRIRIDVELHAPPSEPFDLDSIADYERIKDA